MRMGSLENTGKGKPRPYLGLKPLRGCKSRDDEAIGGGGKDPCVLIARGRNRGGGGSATSIGPL